MSSAKKVNENFVLNEFDDIPLSQTTYQKFASYMYEIAGAAVALGVADKFYL